MPTRATPRMQGELLQGTLDLLVLETLALGPAHRRTIGHAIAFGSEEVPQVEHGARRSIASRTAAGSRRSEARRSTTAARYHRLTPAGRAQLAPQASRWAEIVRQVNRILRPAD